MQAAAKQMIAQGGGGVIINMSSVNALLAIPSLATYALSKGGMKQLTSVAALALAPHKIRVVAVGPGTILTNMIASAIFSSEDARRSVLSRSPIRRIRSCARVRGDSGHAFSITEVRSSKLFAKTRGFCAGSNERAQQFAFRAHDATFFRVDLDTLSEGAKVITTVAT